MGVGTLTSAASHAATVGDRVWSPQVCLTDIIVVALEVNCLVAEHALDWQVPVWSTLGPIKNRNHVLMYMYSA